MHDTHGAQIGCKTCLWAAQPVSVMNLEDLKQELGVNFDGLLGEDLLREFRSVRINYKLISSSWSNNASEDQKSSGYRREGSSLLELGVFLFGLLQDGNIRVGLFPERHKILIRYPCLGSVALKRVGTAETEMR